MDGELVEDELVARVDALEETARALLDEVRSLMAQINAHREVCPEVAA